MEPAEIYVLCESRSASLARRFLDAVLPTRKQTEEVYIFPQYSCEPSDILQSSDLLLQLLEKNKNESYGIYWNAANGGGPEQAMLFYNKDGSMIAGVGGPKEPFDEMLELMAKQVNGNYGYVTTDDPPPGTAIEFMHICRKSTWTNFYEGQIRNSKVSPPGE